MRIVTIVSFRQPRRRGLGPCIIIVAMAAAFGCGGNGCSCLAPLPNGFPAAQRTDNAAQIRVSSTGLEALTDDPAALVAGLTGGPLTFDVPPTCGGTAPICCNGTTPITPCGPIVIDLEEQPDDEPRLVLEPQEGLSQLKVTIRARVHTQTPLQVNIPGATCQLAIDTRTPGDFPDIRIDTDINFVQDPAAGTTRVEVGDPVITQLDANQDLELTGMGFPDSVTCALYSLVLPLAAGTLTSTFEDAIKDAIDGQLCKGCPGGTVEECGEFAAACTDNVCMRADETCLQEVGVAGRLANALPGTLGSIDIYEVAGEYADTNAGGIALGLLGGMLPSGQPRDRCGPPATPPAPVTIDQSEFFAGNERPDTQVPFDIAIGVHENQLDRFAYSAYDGGLLCMTIGTSTVALLTSDTIGLFIPSLSNLVEGTRPLALGLRPQSPPVIVLGRNTFVPDDNGDPVVDEPLLDITFNALELDFFVSVEDQYIRIFTLVADVHLPLGLQIGATGDIIPVLGDLEAAFTNLSVKNSEALTETPEELADVFPTLLELALPQLAGALGGFAVPEIGGLAIDITEITAVDEVQFLAIFGELAPAAMMAPARIDTRAELIDLHLPGTEVFADATRWNPGVRPSLELALGGSAAGLEWSHRLDDGLWSAWSDRPQRTVSSNVLWLQGRHQLEVRARRAGQPRTADLTPVVIDAWIDTLPPTPAIEVVTGGVEVTATDLVSKDALRMRYRIAGGAWADAAVPALIPLHGHAAGDLEIEVVDQAGNVATSRPTSTALAAPAPFHGQAGAGGCSCAAGGDGGGDSALLLGLGAFGLLARRRRRRISARVKQALLAVGFVLVAAAMPACNCGGAPPCGPVECMEGEVEPGAVGRWNGVAADDSRVVVSTYDENLGDLVLVEVVSGSDPAYVAVDGIPDETPVFFPDTYRGGIPTPGPDVGAWSSVALHGGLARIAYQDRDAGTLKVAIEDDRHDWLSYVVDPTPGATLGHYASITITESGNPAVAYMAIGLDDGAGKKAELRLARASGADPADAAAWTTTTIASAPISCAGLCGDDRACLPPAAEGDPETCTAVATSCAAECGNTEACVAGACTAIVADPSADDIPDGVGLFATLLTLPDGRLAVVHYDRSRTALVAHVESGAGSSAFSEVVLDGAPAADGTDNADRGMWASAVAGADGTVHVAYQDSLGDQVFYTSLRTTAGAIELVDDGVRTGGEVRTHGVGAGAVIFLDGTSPSITYQDGLTADLVQANRSGNVWTHADIATGTLLDGFHLAATPDGAWLVWDSLDKNESPATTLSIRELN